MIVLNPTNLLEEISIQVESGVLLLQFRLIDTLGGFQKGCVWGCELDLMDVRGNMCV